MNSSYNTQRYYVGISILLEPFYPLQSSGHMEEITQIEDKKCDLMEKILVDSKKSIRQIRPGVGRRSKKKIQYILILVYINFSIY